MPTLQDYYNNKFQYGLEDYNTSTPEGDTQAVSYNVGYIPELLDLRQKVASGQGTPWDREWYQRQAQAARALPMRDPSTLQYNAGDDAPDRLSGGSPDLGRIMLGLQDRIRSGQATDQERQLFDTTHKALVDQTYRASVPQASDANPFGLGDNLFGALMTVGLGATGGLAAAPLAAGGAGLTTTLGSLGTLSGIAGTGAGVLGQATDQPWLQKLGMGLGAAGGIAGGVGGLANLWSTGVQGLGDAARLASSAGRIAGGLGSVTDNDALKRAGGYLGQAGQLGGLASGLGLDQWLSGTGQAPSLAAAVTPQLATSGVKALMAAIQAARQRAAGQQAQPQSRQASPFMPRTVLGNLQR